MSSIDQTSNLQIASCKPRLALSTMLWLFMRLRLATSGGLRGVLTGLQPGASNI